MLVFPQKTGDICSITKPKIDGSWIFSMLCLYRNMVYMLKPGWVSGRVNRTMTLLYIIGLTYSCVATAKWHLRHSSIPLVFVILLEFPPSSFPEPISKFGRLTGKTNKWEKGYHHAIISSEIPFHAEGRHPHSLMGKNFRSYLLDLRNTSTPFKGVRKALIDTLLDGYETARYGTGVSWVATFVLQGIEGMPS